MDHNAEITQLTARLNRRSACEGCSDLLSAMMNTPTKGANTHIITRYWCGVTAKTHQPYAEDDMTQSNWSTRAHDLLSHDLFNDTSRPAWSPGQTAGIHQQLLSRIVYGTSYKAPNLVTGPNPNPTWESKTMEGNEGLMLKLATADTDRLWWSHTSQWNMVCRGDK